VTVAILMSITVLSGCTLTILGALFAAGGGDGDAGGAPVNEDQYPFAFAVTLGLTVVDGNGQYVPDAQVFVNGQLTGSLTSAAAVARTVAPDPTYPVEWLDGDYNWVGDSGGAISLQFPEAGVGVPMTVRIVRSGYQAAEVTFVYHDTDRRGTAGAFASTTQAFQRHAFTLVASA